MDEEQKAPLNGEEADGPSRPSAPAEPQSPAPPPEGEAAGDDDSAAPQDSASPAEEAAGEKPPAKKKKSSMAPVLRDLTALLIKLTAILLIVTIAFTFLFGAYRNADPGMYPAVKDGDLVFYYRLDKFYHSGDVLVAKYNGKLICLRVVAVAGDVVDINENGLYINGSLQFSKDIYERTYRFEEGVDFPVSVREGELFVLGDARESAVDSRVFGPIRVDDTLGKVMAIFRRRSI